MTFNLRHFDVDKTVSTYKSKPVRSGVTKLTLISFINTYQIKCKIKNSPNHSQLCIWFLVIGYHNTVYIYCIVSYIILQQIDFLFIWA